MSEVKLDVRYAMGHSYPETWKLGELFCPECGKQGVWEEQSDGDYYVGANFLCIECCHAFTIQGPYNAKESDGETCWLQRIETIRGSR